MKGLAQKTDFGFRLMVMLICLPLAFACRQSDVGAAGTPNPDESAYAIDMIDRSVTIRMEGPDAADFRGVIRLRIQAPNADAPLNMMVISTNGYIDVGETIKLSIGIVLIDLYKGDGEYTLAPNVAPADPPDPAHDEALTSNSRVTFYADNSGGPERTLRAYDTLTKPCPIVIRQKGKAGEVRCPEIRSVENTTVSFEMTWGD